MSGRCSAKNMDLIYNIRYTEPAVFDLNKILLYLTGYNSYNIVDRFQKEIENRFESIKYHPYICQTMSLYIPLMRKIKSLILCESFMN